MNKSIFISGLLLTLALGSCYKDKGNYGYKDCLLYTSELKNYAGKYVLLDFWASWCGPCRREMPNVVKLYKECKGKNFEIIGISLDQKPEPWKKAVKELKMTWPQACDFQVWYGPVARKYNLSAVPYTVLINPEGKVEALDLRGEELINTIKNLVKGNKKK